MAGLHKHKWSYTVKYAPDHFGHNEFKPPNQVKTSRWLNISDLSSLKTTMDSEIDLGSLGYDKLLGEGKVDRPYRLIVPRASSRAVEKIRGSGGSVRVQFAIASVSGKDDNNSKQKTKLQTTK